MKFLRKVLGRLGKVRWYVLVVILLPAAIYIPGIMGGIPYPSETSGFSDMMISHYPYSLVLKQALINFKTIPLWSSLIYSGVPFAANPLAGLFYLPGWIALIFPLPAGISVVLALHVIFGSYGLYFLLKAEGLGEAASLTGALVFGFMPKIAALYGAGHVTLIYAVSWTPWLLLSGRKYPGGWRSGMIAGMLFLADPRWSIYAGLFWISYEIAHRYKIVGLKGIAIFFLKASLSAFMVASPLILPLIEFSTLSTRSALTSQDINLYSLPGNMLPGLVIPGAGGNIEWVIYVGGGVICILFAQLLLQRLRKENLFWIIWFFLGIFLSMALFSSSLDWITKIPLLSMLRVPARAFIISLISSAIILAKTLQYLSDKDENDGLITKWFFGTAVFSILIIAGFLYLKLDPFFSLIWGFAFAGIVSMLFIAAIRSKKNKEIIIWLISFLLIADLAISNFMFFDIRDGSGVNDKPGYLETLAGNQEVYQRIYSPSYSIPQHLAALYDLELADGVDPMQLTAYYDFMEKATGVGTAEYAVSIPAFESGNPEFDNEDAEMNTEYLSLLNVGSVISEFEITSPDLELLDIIENKYIYTLKTSLPRAWIEPSEGVNLPPKGNEINSAEIIAKRPNNILIQAVGPGRLVLSEIIYPGWSAVIDGEPVGIEPAYGVLRSVQLDEGRHDIVFSYHPVTAYLGILLACGFWINAFLLSIRRLI